MPERAIAENFSACTTSVPEDDKQIIMPYPEKSKGYMATKRVLDVALSVIGLVVLSPVLLITAIAIKLDSEGPVIFKQIRIGKNGQKFTMYKFRSMGNDAEKQKAKLAKQNEKGDIIFKIKDDPRVTRVGKFIRKTSIDELPQLVNIIKSEMSIVGPRPPLPNEVAKYSKYQRQRLCVKGGLTCFWQVSGRSNLSFDEWVELDLKYVREMSLWVDIKLIFRTFKAVFSGNGAA